MNDYIYVGKIVNTHGIKGELRILSNFSKKEVFNVGNNLYIGDNKIKEEIISYRVHKDFDMVTFRGYTNINEVLKYLKCDVYIKRSELNIDSYLIEDLIDCNIIDNEENIGKVENILYNNGNTLLVIKGSKTFYIPINSNYIKEVDINKRIIITDNAKELIL